VTRLITLLVVGLNAIVNPIARFIFAPIAVLPGWLSVAVVGVVTGLLTLVAFKFTSNQRAIKRVRNDIKANLLAVSLFKDSVLVSLKSQGRIIVSAAKLLVYSIVPLAVMLVPMALLLSQLSLWYQARPLHVGESAVVTMNLNGPASVDWPKVQLDASPAFKPTLGPVKVSDQRAVCWNIEADYAGYHRLVIDIGGQKIDKELAIGDGLMRVSLARPSSDWSDALLNPAESPLKAESPVRSVEIQYPQRAAFASGTNTWVIYWFIVSFAAALCCRRVLNVQL
jgi:uncharacterized membrane protein (DUF106 family)